MIRYAICATPPADDPLWALGSSILGYDAVTGLDATYPDHPLFHDPLSLAWSAAPRRYGLQAMLKAPFQLAEARTEAQLRSDLATFAGRRRPVAFDLTMAPVGHALALLPAGAEAALRTLAADCVRHFDPFRAPMTPEDRERRHPDGLIARQVENLDNWGDPWVFDDFQFHMALTGDLDPTERHRLEPVLRDLLATVPLRMSVDALMLFIQTDPEGRYSAADRFAFGV